VQKVTDDPVTGCGSWATNTAGVASPADDAAHFFPRHTAAGAGSGTNTSCVDVSYKTLVESDAAYYERTLCVKRFKHRDPVCVCTFPLCILRVAMFLRYTEMEMFIAASDTVAAVTEFIAFQVNAVAFLANTCSTIACDYYFYVVFVDIVSLRCLPHCLALSSSSLSPLPPLSFQDSVRDQVPPELLASLYCQVRVIRSRRHHVR